MITTNPIDTMGAGDSAFCYSSCFINNTKNEDNESKPKSNNTEKEHVIKVKNNEP